MLQKVESRGSMAVTAAASVSGRLAGEASGRHGRQQQAVTDVKHFAPPFAPVIARLEARELQRSK